MEKKKLVDLKKVKRKSVFDMNCNTSGISKIVLKLNIKSNKNFYNKDKQSFLSNSNINLNNDEKI